MQIGYTMMCEQRSPKDLVDDVVLAEQAGFDFSVISDHYHPWLEAQGHSPYAWSVLGAAAVQTERIGLMTYVTCPIRRYHPAVVAQQAATVAMLSDGRFRLGLGAGESLNEHVVGGGWPNVSTRHEMLGEAVDLIRALWASSREGQYANWHGKHFEVESAKIFDMPEELPEIGIAMSGSESCQLAGAKADIGVAVEPEADLVTMFAEAGGSGKPVIGQGGCCYGPDAAKQLKLAHEQFRWFVGGWKVNADLPTPMSFDAASQFVREEDLAEQIPHGPDIEPYVQAVKQFADAGFTHFAFVQIGPDQRQFCEWYATELKPALAGL
jgi:G6PDH family F420-dependent oxidoreductase